MGRLFVVHLEGKIYSCKHCKTHLALYEDIISKSFHCKHGKAYLFNKVSNVTIGETEDRMMMTGKHTVADIFCVSCGSIVGWRYETAHEKSQKYKEGKSVLERLYFQHSSGLQQLQEHDSFLYDNLENCCDRFKISGPDGCGSIVGWRYETAHEKSQKYKEGKSVLERFKISGPDGSNYWVSSHGRHIGGSDADDS